MRPESGPALAKNNGATDILVFRIVKE